MNFDVLEIKPTKGFIMSDYIAKREFCVALSSDKRVDAVVKIMAPFEDDGHFTCVVKFEGLFDRSYQMHGDDSMQALCLAIRHASSLLENVVADGGEFFHHDDNSKIDPAYLLG